MLLETQNRLLPVNTCAAAIRIVPEAVTIPFAEVAAVVESVTVYAVIPLPQVLPERDAETRSPMLDKLMLVVVEAPTATVTSN